MKKSILAFISPVIGGICLAITLSVPSARAHDLPLDTLNLPPGFGIEVFAELINPRQLATAGDGVYFAGSRRAGNLYAVIDRDQDWRADDVITIDRNLDMPSGIALRDGDLYVGAVDRILVYRDIVDSLDDIPDAEVVYDSLPTEKHHGWKYLAFGPDGQLYFNVGAPCNICLEENPRFATIMSLDLDRSPLQPAVYAAGVRNSVGFSWHPETGELWFTDNGRDMMGDHVPPCEVNRAAAPGMHFGFPFIHGRDIPDPEFGGQAGSTRLVPPEVELDPHVAPLGMLFYTGTMFPAEYHGKLLVAEHGSWNRSPAAGHTGYRITLVDPETGDYSVFIDGWLGDNNVGWGRPVDFLQMKDGSLLVSDDGGNAIYRIFYSANDSE